MTCKYALYPGKVRSSTDGDYHFIDSVQLARLYGAPLSECLVMLPEAQYHSYASVAKRNLAETLIPLRPRFDGVYTMPVLDAKPPSNQATTASTFQGAALTLDKIEKMVEKYKAFPKGEWLVMSPDGKVWVNADPAKLMQVLLVHALPTFLDTNFRVDDANPPPSTT